MKRAGLLLIAATLLACGSRAPGPVERTVGGETRVGAFVSPYEYEWFVRGIYLAERGELEEAARALELARLGANVDPLLLARLAEVRDRLGEDDAVASLLAEAERVDPASEAVHLARGRIAERHERLDEAADAYGRAIAAAPRSDRGPLAMARLERARDAGARATEALDAFFERGGTSNEALALRLALALERGDAARAIRVADLLRAADATVDLHLVAAAIASLDAGDADTAVQLLERTASSPEREALLVRALAAAGRVDEAELRLSREEPEVFGGAAPRLTLFVAIGRPGTALALLERHAGTPEADRLARVRGEALRAMGRLDEAATAFASVPRAASDYEAARLALAEVRIAQRRPADARSALTEGLRALGGSEALESALANLAR